MAGMADLHEKRAKKEEAKPQGETIHEKHWKQRKMLHQSHMNQIRDKNGAQRDENNKMAARHQQEQEQMQQMQEAEIQAQQQASSTLATGGGAPPGASPPAGM